jgi:hypothetical protein
MTVNDVFDRLVELAAMPNGGARGDIVLSCDMIHQDALYRMQEHLAALLADVAIACGPTQARRLQRRFPSVFQANDPR